jgi:hypothetical protein
MDQHVYHYSEERWTIILGTTNFVPSSHAMMFFCKEKIWRQFLGLVQSFFDICILGLLCTYTPILYRFHFLSRFKSLPSFAVALREVSIK